MAILMGKADEGMKELAIREAAPADADAVFHITAEAFKIRRRDRGAGIGGGPEGNEGRSFRTSKTRRY